MNLALVHPHHFDMEVSGVPAETVLALPSAPIPSKVHLKEIL
jgi:hypothetical protein